MLKKKSNLSEADFEKIEQLTAERDYYKALLRMFFATLMDEDYWRRPTEMVQREIAVLQMLFK